jgi:hypothetical protein
MAMVGWKPLTRADSPYFRPDLRRIFRVGPKKLVVNREGSYWNLTTRQALSLVHEKLFVNYSPVPQVESALPEPTSIAAVKKVFKKSGGQVEKEGELELRLMHSDYVTSPPYMNEVISLWDIGWNPGRDPLGGIFHISPAQLQSMFSNSPDGIFLGYLDKKLVHGIWSLTLDMDNQNLKKMYDTYKKVTANLTFRNIIRDGNAKICISVVTAPECRGWATEDSWGIGQNGAIQQKIKAQRSPYVTVMYTYSRTAFLRFCIEMMWQLRQSFGKINFENGKMFMPDGRELNLDREGIFVRKGEAGEKDYLARIKDHLKSKEAGRIKLEFGRYILPDGSLLQKDETGVFFYNDDTQAIEYLMKPAIYSSSWFDLMKNFHGGLGGKVVALFPDGRPGDLDALDHNMVFEFDLFSPFDKFYEVLYPFQQDFIVKLANYLSDPKKADIKDREQFIREIKLLDNPKVIKKALLQYAFSIEKVRMIRDELIRGDLYKEVSTWKVNSTQ